MISLIKHCPNDKIMEMENIHYFQGLGMVWLEKGTGLWHSIVGMAWFYESYS